MARVYHVTVVPGIHFDCLAADEQDYEEGAEVIVRCENYEDFATVSGVSPEGVDEKQAEKQYQSKGKGRRIQGRTMPRIRRGATLQDRSRAHERDTMAASMAKTAQRKIQEHGLSMKLLNAHVSFDGKLVIFQFMSEGRVDFRHLLRDLSGALHMRVELRQVGVRDEASIQGGLGSCGRAFCCATFLSRFESVNVRMAKTQGLSLNPSNISGACGRLKCCLRYETDFYAEMKRILPRPGSRCKTPQGPGRVLDCNALTQDVRVRLDDKNGEIASVPADQIDTVQPAGGKQEAGKKKEGGGQRPSGSKKACGQSKDRTEQS